MAALSSRAWAFDAGHLHFVLPCARKTRIPMLRVSSLTTPRKIFFKISSKLRRRSSHQDLRITHCTEFRRLAQARRRRRTNTRGRFGIHWFWVFVSYKLLYHCINTNFIPSEDITKLEIQMEYKNYGSKIVLAHRVALQGWPAELPIEKNIDGLSIQNLRLLVAKLRSKEIYWAAASEEELRHIAERVPTRQRAERSDKGKERSHYKQRKPKKAPVRDDSEDEDEDEDDGDRSSNKARKRKQRTADKTVSVLDDDDDDDDENGEGNLTRKKTRKRKRRSVNDGDNDNDNNNDNDENDAPAGPSHSAASCKGKGRSTSARSSSACSSSTHSESRLAEPNGRVAVNDLVRLTVDLPAGARPIEPECNNSVDESHLGRLTVDAEASGSTSASTGSFSWSVDATPAAAAAATATQPNIGSLRDALDFPLPDLDFPPLEQILRLPTPPHAEDTNPSSYTYNNTSSPMDSFLMFPNFNYL